MDTKDQLIKTIKEWVKTDNEIRAFQKEVRKKQEEKKKISKDLMDIMVRNEIDCFDIKDGQILYSKKNVKKPITQKNLLGILANYCKGDIEKATEINNFILENREEVMKEEIVRKIRKTIPSDI
jgi:hypothetical protein